jgi:hypothetical protein
MNEQNPNDVYMATALLRLIQQLELEQQFMELVIARTPTGPIRNDLTEINIILRVAIMQAKEMIGEAG